MPLPVPGSSRPLPRGPALSRPGLGQNAPVQITKLTSADGFVVVDAEGAARSSGVVRWAKKVLQDGAVNLARHRTYAYAAMGIEAGGASAGVNSLPDGRSDALAGFLADAPASGVRFDAGKGVTADDLAPLAAADDRSPLRLEGADALEAAGLVAALTATVGDLSGLRIALEAPPPGGTELTALLTAAGATVTEVDPGSLDADCDVLGIGSKVGVVDHENVGSVRARTLLPLAPLPITARGLATAGRAGIAVIPDFVALGAPLVAHWPDSGERVESLSASATERITAVLTESASHPEGTFLGAAELAERFLGTWLDPLPFGRPIA